MTRRRTLIAGAAAGALVLSVGGVTLAYAQGDEAYEPVHVAHRAGGGLAPEMTDAAFTSALEHNPDRIEVDVQLSSDDVPVLMHDDNLKRTTDVEEVFPGREEDPVNTFTFDELSTLDAGAYFHEDFAGERIPTFDDIMDYVHDEGVGVSIELKSPSLNPGLEQVVSDVIDSDERWNDLIENEIVSFISFDQESLKRAVELQPDIPAAWLQTDVPDDETLAEVAEWTDIFGTSYRTLQDDTLDRLRSHGFEVILWTMNSPEVLSWALENEIEYLTTDFGNVLDAVENDADPFPDANGVEVSGVETEGDLDPEEGEHVVLTNVADEAIDVSGYYVRDSPHNVLRVGDGYVLEPGAELRVYTGPGTNAEDRYYNDLPAPILFPAPGGTSLATWSADNLLLDVFAY
ncbi:MAG: glycerophosphodiester phosphodiesterase family protein [Stackebrandtia sp.]